MPVNASRCRFRLRRRIDSSSLIDPLRLETRVRLAICDSLSLDTVVLLNDLGASALESQNRKPDPCFVFEVMHIFIDESGIFAPLPNNRASVVAALIVPTSKKTTLIQKFLDLSVGWPKEKGEVKGRLLDENQIAQTVALLEAQEVIVEMNAIDSALQTETDLKTIKTNMTKVIKGWVRPGHPLKAQITQIAEAYEKTSLQLFTQAYLMQTLVYRVIQHSISSYARRIPKELSHFHWIFDGKDKNVTEFEELGLRPSLPVLTISHI